MENILDFYVQKYQAEDEERCANSTYSTTYKNINSGYEMQEYLEKDCPIHIKRTVSQLRTAGKRPYINMKGIIYSWNAEEMCTNGGLQPQTETHRNAIEVKVAENQAKNIGRQQARRQEKHEQEDQAKWRCTYCDFKREGR
ncbi:hypothetical protein M8J75_014559 [Diaphorina citri]|nr:hypothetical protein M8J75_014559 [Diaphorina citri]